MTIEQLFTNLSALLTAVSPVAAGTVALAAACYGAHGFLTDSASSLRKAKGGAIGAALLYAVGQVVALLQNTGSRIMGG
jgi:hypothetical protein